MGALLLAVALTAAAVFLVPRVWSQSQQRTGASGGTGSSGVASTSAATQSPGRSSTSVRFPAAMAGSWAGTLAQSNGPRWQIRITIPADGSTASVSFPDPALACSGTLTALSISGGAVVTGERITSGSCTSTGRTTLTLQNENTMTLAYLPENNRYSADATLSRISS